MELKIIKGVSRIAIKNEPFKLFGRMIPKFDGKKWHYEEELWRPNDIREMCFPQENYNPQASRSTFVGAFEGDECVGLAVLTHHMFKFMYLEDLKVKAAYRGQGIATELIRKSFELALQKGYRGLYTIGQDNNLAACRLYLRNGFKIGGFDNTVYAGTNQEDKGDIYFYLQEEVTFRMATVDDAAILVDIYNDAFREDYRRFGTCPGYGRSIEEMAASIRENPKHMIFLGGKPVGIISYYHNGRGKYHIGCIAIKSGYQRMGLGSQAFRHMLSLCKDWEEITLYTPADKTENLSFYSRKLGFESDGHVVEDGVKLIKFVKEKQFVELDDVPKTEEEAQAIKAAIGELDSIIAELEESDDQEVNASDRFRQPEISEAAESEPAESAPAEPEPVQPAEPEPAEPEPAEPAEPEPVQPATAEFSEPAQPAYQEPEPEPAQPEPTQPAEPEPVQPATAEFSEPAQPAYQEPESYKQEPDEADREEIDIEALAREALAQEGFQPEEESVREDELYIEEEFDTSAAQIHESTAYKEDIDESQLSVEELALRELRKSGIVAAEPATAPEVKEAEPEAEPEAKEADGGMELDPQYRFSSIKKEEEPAKQENDWESSGFQRL